MCNTINFCLILCGANRFLLNWLENIVNYLLHIAHFFPCKAEWTNLRQPWLRPLPKFGGKVWKIFWTQPLGLGQISNHFVSFRNEIFCSTQISQFPTLQYYEEHVVFVSNQIYYWIYKCTTCHHYTNIIKTI